MRVRCAGVAMALLIMPALLRAQPGASRSPDELVGWVVDAAGRPMGDAEVLIAGTAFSTRSDARGFWRCLNPMRAGLNRVEADELSYCLHIVLRFELELALLEQDLPVAELPHQWNRKMEQLLGVKPSNDAEGCLQDVHWSEGLFGYFPSYALGHLISAQLSEAMESQIGPLEQQLAAGRDGVLQEWLAGRVWPLGRQVNAEQLGEQVTGSALSPQPFLRYLEQKLERLGG